jgi:tetratricopeptide (TPR) repeat protein
MKPLSSVRDLCVAFVLAIFSAGLASAQTAESLVKGKALYAEASYDDALRVLGTVEGPEAQQYRALCFLALGKTHEAEGALEALIKQTPEYALSDADSPPRLMNLFAQTKRRLLPALVRRLFTEARDDFQAKELDRARGKFERVLALTHDPAVAGADFKDLQILTNGYLDIVKNAPPPAPAPVFSGPTASTPAPAASTTSAPASTAAASSFPASAPGRTPSAGAASTSTALPASAKPRPPAVVPAVTIRQTVPSYTPQPGVPAKALSGSIRIVIGADGKVKSAEMAQSVDPRYDIRLVAAAKSWLYKPATLDGNPIQSEKVVQVSVGTP